MLNREIFEIFEDFFLTLIQNLLNGGSLELFFHFTTVYTTCKSKCIMFCEDVDPYLECFCNCSVVEYFFFWTCL